MSLSKSLLVVPLWACLSMVSAAVPIGQLFGVDAYE